MFIISKHSGDLKNEELGQGLAYTGLHIAHNASIYFNVQVALLGGNLAKATTLITRIKVPSRFLKLTVSSGLLRIKAICPIFRYTYFILFFVLKFMFKQFKQSFNLFGPKP